MWVQEVGELVSIEQQMHKGGPIFVIKKSQKE